MNILSAIKSGKPFSRPGWGWIRQSQNRNAFEFIEDLEVADISRPDDLLAEDWQIKEQPISITREQFWEAADQVRPEIPDNDLNYVCRESFKRLAFVLGLEP